MEHVSASLIILKSLVRTPIGTGEHGVGLGKKKYLVDELGANTVGLMKTIKEAIDPTNIMNPGKVRDSAFEQLYSQIVTFCCSFIQIMMMWMIREGNISP